MKHNIRINGKIQTLDFELGSGILDDNGQEIFEGDKVCWSFNKNDPDVVYSGIAWWRGSLLLVPFSKTSIAGLRDSALHKYEEAVTQAIIDSPARHGTSQPDITGLEDSIMSIVGHIKEGAT